MAGISVQARKAKGRANQVAHAKAVVETFDGLTDDDVRSCSSGANGADVLLSAAAKAVYPFSIECKQRASGYTSLYDDLEQARGHDTLTPILVLRQDRKKKRLVVIEEDAFLDLAARAAQIAKS